jgi:hypothetical protein
MGPKKLQKSPKNQKSFFEKYPIHASIGKDWRLFDSWERMEGHEGVIERVQSSKPKTRSCRKAPSTTEIHPDQQNEGEEITSSRMGYVSFPNY